MCSEYFTYITSVKKYSFLHLGDKNLKRTQLNKFLNMFKVT